MKFRTKLILLCTGVIACIAACVSWVVYSENSAALEDAIKRNFEESAFHAMQGIDRTLCERLADLKIMATAAALTSDNPEPLRITKRLIDFRNAYNYYLSISFLTIDGRKLADTSGMGIGRKFAGQPPSYWDDVVQGKISIASDIHFSEDMKMPIIFLAAPVYTKKGTMTGVVVAEMPAVKLYAITEDFLKIPEKKEVQIDLANKDGLLLYSNHNLKGILKERVNNREALQRASAGEKQGSGIYRYSGAEDAIYAFAREKGYFDFPGNKWTLIISTPAAAAFASATVLRDKVILLFCVSLILALVIVLNFSRMLVKPIQRLRDAFARVGAGNMETHVAVVSRDEIGELADSFNRMVLHLQETTASRDALNREMTLRKMSEGELRRERDFISAVLDTAGVLIVVLNCEGKIVRFNRECEEVTGYGFEAVYGNYFWDIFLVESETAAVKKIFFDLCQGEFPKQHENFWKTKDGALRLIQWSNTVLRGHNDTVKYVISTGIDITEQKQAQEALLKVNKAYQALSLCSQAIMRAGSEQELLHEAVHIVREVCGYSLVWIGFAEHDAGKTVRLVAQAGDREGYLDSIRITWDDSELGRGPTGTAIRTGKSVVNNNTLCTPSLAPWRDKQVKHGFVSSAAFPVGTGSEVLGALTVYASSPDAFTAEEIQLLTELSANLGYGIVFYRIDKERRQAEDDLRRSNERLDLLADTASRLLKSDSPQAVVESLCRSVMDFLDCQAFFNFLVVEEKQRLQLNACAGIPEEEKKRIEWLDYGSAVCGCAARDGARIVAEDIMNTPDIRTELVKSYGIKAYACHPLISGDRVIGTLSFGTRTRSRFSEDELSLMKAVADLVAIAIARKQTEEKLLYLSSFPERNLNPVLELDADNMIQYMNPSTQRLFPDLREKGIEHQFLKGIDVLMRKLQEGDQPPPVRDVTVGADYYQQTLHYLEREKLLRIYSTDITLRKRAENEIRRESEIRGALSALYKPLVAPSVSIPAVARLILDQALKLTGSRHGFVASIDPKTGDNIPHVYSDMVEGMCDVTAEMKKKGFPRGADGLYCGLWGYALNTLEPFYTNAPQTHPSSTGIPQGHLPLQRFLSVPVMLGSELVGQIALANKVGEYTGEDLEAMQRLAEYYALAIQRRRAEERIEIYMTELKRSNEDLQEFASIASHDLQEPLRSISGFLQLIEKKYNDRLDDLGRDYMSRTRKNAIRLQDMINDLLTYSRITAHGNPIEEESAEEILMVAMENLRRTIEKSNALITHDPLPTIQVDRLQLVRVFQNLIGNSIKYCDRDRPVIHISAEYRDDQWVISVADNGIGIEPEYTTKIFGIFQRLHGREVYPGTGLGLAVCKKIIESHGGRIWVESTPGEGSTFYFTLQKSGVYT